VTLAGLSTRTTVTFDPSLPGDVLELSGRVVSGDPLDRASALLDRVRAAARAAGGRELGPAHVVSANDFPTASGLASSASGFAALALAAVRAAGLSRSAAEVSDLARRGSASAARSLFGGFVELPAGPEGTDGTPTLSARQVAEPSALALSTLVCVVTEEPKTVPSTVGMLETARRSPYYGEWLREGPRLHARMLDALRAGDLPELGALAEASAFAMHASAMAAGVFYLRGVTLDVLGRVRALRAEGLHTYATMDAGPHVKVFTADDDVPRARTALIEVPGVLRVLVAKPGDGARAARDG
jgi:diphosphomevalonate decarboxylase